MPSAASFCVHKAFSSFVAGRRSDCSAPRWAWEISHSREEYPKPEATEHLFAFAKWEAYESSPLAPRTGSPATDGPRDVLG